MPACGRDNLGGMTRAAADAHLAEPVSSRGPVGHPGSARHLTVLVVAFVVTVTVTRIFLAATGYPRIGGTTFHLAHALWGGLLLTVAVVAVLSWANRWALRLG